MFDEDTENEDSPLSMANEEEETEQEGALAQLSTQSMPADEGYRLLMEQARKASEREQQLFEAELARIEAAKQRLLAKPEKLTGRERLDMILESLSRRPTSTSDPRFFERKNIGTILRDIGEAGTAAKAEERKRAEERAAGLDELEQLKAKFLLPKAAQQAQQARQELIREEQRRARAMQGPQDTAYMRNLKYRADLLGITTEELLRREQDPSGLNLKPSEIRSIRLEVASTLNGPKERLNLINEGLNNLRLAAQGNPQAEAQLNRSLASISGDKQLSLAEVETVVGAGSFAQRVTNAISKFFTGGAGDLTNEQKKELLETYEAYHAKRYNESRNRLKNIYSSAGLTSLPEDMFDSPYISSAEKRKKKQEEDAKAKENESTESSGSITLSGGKTVRPIGQ